MSSKQPVVLFEQHHLTNTHKYDPFILTDILADYSGKHQVAICHFWTMNQQIILGMQDTRVTHLADALEIIEQNGYKPVVRNSGGLAVVADQGILNFSLILPQDFMNQTSINHGYETMKQIISDALSAYHVTIESFEVSDSYCPGEYDLSIHSKKIAGIAQRRIRKGLGIMIYISVCGEQQKRGELVRDFYQAGLKDNFGEGAYPPVNPDSMENLSTLLSKNLDVHDMQQLIMESIKNSFDFNQESQTAFENFLLSEEYELAYQKNYERMIQRNESIQSIRKEDR